MSLCLFYLEGGDKWNNYHTSHDHLYASARGKKMVLDQYSTLQMKANPPLLLPIDLGGNSFQTSNQYDPEYE